MLKEIIHRFDKLIINNNGYSIKNFILFIGATTGLLSILSFLVLLFLDFFIDNKSINIDLYGYSLVITSVEGIILGLLGLKVISEKNENKKNKDDVI